MIDSKYTFSNYLLGYTQVIGWFLVYLKLTVNRLLLI